jgi:hypothetical protein
VNRGAASRLGEMSAATFWSAPARWRFGGDANAAESASKLAQSETWRTNCWAMGAGSGVVEGVR